MIKYILLMLCIMCLPAFPAGADADFAGWRIVQISAADRVAVAKSPEGELRLVRAGDRLGEHITITGFDDDRLILERPGEWGRATLLVRCVDGRQEAVVRERQPLRKSDVAGDPVSITVDPVRPKR